MTANQSNQLVKNPNTKKAIMALKKFAEIEAVYKEAEKEVKEATELIKQSMIDQGISKMNIDLPGLSGYITLAERTNYKADDLEQVADEFLKPALDTEKVKAQHTLTGQLPVGVVESRTQYVTKKFKVEK